MQNILNQRNSISFLLTVLFCGRLSWNEVVNSGLPRINQTVSGNMEDYSSSQIPHMQCRVWWSRLCFIALIGYLNNAKATAESITPDGWFHSGDTGYYDEEGHFYIVDRLKELIKYKGFQVTVFEVNYCKFDVIYILFYFRKYIFPSHRRILNLKLLRRATVVGVFLQFISYVFK